MTDPRSASDLPEPDPAEATAGESAPELEAVDDPVPQWDFQSDLGPEDCWGPAVRDVLRAEGWTSQ